VRGGEIASLSLHWDRVK